MKTNADVAEWSQGRLERGIKGILHERQICSAGIHFDRKCLSADEMTKCLMFRCVPDIPAAGFFRVSLINAPACERPKLGLRQRDMEG